MAKKHELQTLTTHELAEMLLREPDVPVVFAFNSGDYWKTVLAGAVDAAEVGRVVWSGYHNQWRLVDEEKAEEDEDGSEAREAADSVPALILSGSRPW